MPRLHTIYLPGPGSRFAFILDQANPMSDLAEGQWRVFAESCGAAGIVLTADTIDTDPDREISDGWEPEDDEPVDYITTDHSGCHHSPPPGLMRSLIETLAAAGNAEVWEPWEPANLDPESPKVMTHREEACPALNGSVLGCPMHEVFEGPWSVWPYYASRTAEAGGVVTRICDHGVTHPTPEEYVGGLDTPHLCDGCPCANDEDRDRYAIVVSDLANTRLPRGTLLLGVKDDPTPVTAPPSGEEARGACGNQLRRSLGFPLECSLPLGHDGAHSGGGKGWDNTGAWPFYPGYQSAPGDGFVPVRVADLKPCDGKVTLDERIPSAEPCALGMGHRGTHLTLSGGALVGYLFAGNPIPVPEGEGPIAFVAGDLGEGWGAPSMPAMDAVRANIEDAYARSGLVAPADPSLYPSMPEIPGADAEPGSVRRGGIPSPVRVQPLGADGEPVGEAKDYPLAGPVAVTEKEYGALIDGACGETVNCFCGLTMGDCEHDGTASDVSPLQAVANTIENVKAQSRMAPTAEPLDVISAEVEDTLQCTAASNGARCTRDHQHEGLHTFNRV
jgi:hypothetical protein